MELNDLMLVLVGRLSHGHPGPPKAEADQENIEDKFRAQQKNVRTRKSPKPKFLMDHHAYLKVYKKKCFF